MHTDGTWILGAEPGLAESLTPEGLVASHPAWARACDALGAFEEVASPGDGAGHFLSRGDAFGPDPVMLCGECTSSLDVAHELAGRGQLPPWAAVLAVSQTGGRGQLRRPWVSPAGNIYAAWRWPKPPREWDTWIPLLAGYWVAESLSELGFSVDIKWPNDLLIQGRKVGGILVEERGDVLLVGLGINVHSAPGADELREQWAPPAGCLSDFVKNGMAVPNIPAIWRRLDNFAKNEYLSQVSGKISNLFLKSIESRLAWIGREILVHDGSGKASTATVSGLAADGGLLLKNDGGHHVLHSGSISGPATL